MKTRQSIARAWQGHRADYRAASELKRFGGPRESALALLAHRSTVKSGSRNLSQYLVERQVEIAGGAG